MHSSLFLCWILLPKSVPSSLTSCTVFSSQQIYFMLFSALSRLSLQPWYITLPHVKCFGNFFHVHQGLENWFYLMLISSVMSVASTTQFAL